MADDRQEDVLLMYLGLSHISLQKHGTRMPNMRKVFIHSAIRNRENSRPSTVNVQNAHVAFSKGNLRDRPGICNITNR